MAVMLLDIAVEARDAVKLPTMHRKASSPPLPPTAENHPI